MQIQVNRNISMSGSNNMALMLEAKRAAERHRAEQLEMFEKFEMGKVFVSADSELNSQYILVDRAYFIYRSNI